MHTSQPGPQLNNCSGTAFQHWFSSLLSHSSLNYHPIGRKVCCRSIYIHECHPVGFSAHVTKRMAIQYLSESFAHHKQLLLNIQNHVLFGAVHVPCSVIRVLPNNLPISTIVTTVVSGCPLATYMYLHCHLPATPRQLVGTCSALQWLWLH